MAMNKAMSVVILALVGAMFISEGEVMPSIEFPISEKLRASLLRVSRFLC